MRIGILLSALCILGPVLAGRAWGQHGGHDMGAMPAMTSMDRAAAVREEVRSRTKKLTKLQEKIDALEARLEDPNLAPKKRPGLEKRLKKLYAKKDQILGADGRSSSPAPRPAESSAVNESCAADAPACGMEAKRTR